MGDEDNARAPVNRLLGAVAHELRNPLDGLKNALYLVRQANDGNSSQYLDVAEDELERIQQIVTNMLDRYRGRHMEAESVSLTEIVQKTLTAYASKIALKRVAVQTRYSSRGTMQSLPGEMRQVFTNLVKNALEALPASAGKLVLRVTDSRDWKTLRTCGVRVTVADTGSGISHDDLKKIFSGAFTSKGENGTGIGLWMAKQIVEDHSGSIHVRSSVNEPSWTCFSVFLPAEHFQRPAQQSISAA